MSWSFSLFGKGSEVSEELSNAAQALAKAAGAAKALEGEQVSVSASGTQASASFSLSAGAASPAKEAPEAPAQDGSQEIAESAG